MKSAGREYEAIAEKHLQSRGCKPVTRNYLCRFGEIDLIMKSSDMLIFVEVRYRQHRYHGDAFESVDQRKQRRIILAARHFLAHSPQFRDFPCRFDVLGMHRNANGSVQCEWLTNAFSEQVM